TLPQPRQRADVVADVDGVQAQSVQGLLDLVVSTCLAEHAEQGPEFTDAGVLEICHSGAIGRPGCPRIRERHRPHPEADGKGRAGYNGTAQDSLQHNSPQIFSGVIGATGSFPTPPRSTFGAGDSDVKLIFLMSLMSSAH